MSPRILFLLALATGVCQAQAGSPLPADASVQPVTEASATPALPLTSKTLLNPAPYIPPQCYTKTKDDRGKAHNPCYTCHTAPRRPNYTSDPDLQLAYDFTESAGTNHWKNLFRDRTAAVAATGDDEIHACIRDSNYFDAQGNTSLAARLADVPQAWVYAGFIEDANGQLRPQRYEERVFCVSCHGGIGGNRDSGTNAPVG